MRLRLPRLKKKHWGRLVRDVPLPGDGPMLLDILIRDATTVDDGLNREEWYVYECTEYRRVMRWPRIGCPCEICFQEGRPQWNTEWN